jgi:general secretion pathway protein D
MGSMQNASLTEVIDILARQLKINYIIDKGVTGSVTINTYGETKNLDIRSLLDLILRINGAGMVQEGDIYRIVPINAIQSLPLKPEVNAKDIPEDDRPMLNLIFLKYAAVADMAALLKPFLSEGATVTAYAPANLLFVLDSRRSMHRLMELTSIFDSNEFAAQRVRLFEVKDARPSDLAKELDGIIKSISLAEKNAPVKFLPIDRINTIVAVAPSPGVFDEIAKWIKKLDVPIKITAGSIDNYVYRVKYGRAELIAGAIMQLYGGYPGGGFGGGGGGGYNPFPGAGMPGGPYGTGAGSYSGGLGGAGGAGMYGAGGMNSYNGGNNSVSPYGNAPGAAISPATIQQVTGIAPGGAAPGTDQTGNYLQGSAAGLGMGMPRIVPNPNDNTILIQASPQQYASILKLLKDIDVAPRQVLIDARIYEVDLSGTLSNGVSYYLGQQGSKNLPAVDSNKVIASLAGSPLGVSLSAGALIGQSRQFLAFVTSAEGQSRSKVISAPSIIATDSIAASINVGDEVPTLTATVGTGLQSSGTSLFANQVQNRNSGVTLSILARISASGIVTLVINQEVSSPEASPIASGIDSPSFSKRSVQTQVTMQDGDTIAIGGIINETTTWDSNGFPLLHRIPILGYAFGNKSYSKKRTELIIFMRPRVIYDATQMVDASDELKNELKNTRKVLRDEEK